MNPAVNLICEYTFPCPCLACVDDVSFRFLTLLWVHVAIVEFFVPSMQTIAHLLPKLCKVVDKNIKVLTDFLLKRINIQSD